VQVLHWDVNIGGRQSCVQSVTELEGNMTQQQLHVMKPNHVCSYVEG